MQHAARHVLKIHRAVPGQCPARCSSLCEVLLDLGLLPLIQLTCKSPQAHPDDDRQQADSGLEAGGHCSLASWQHGTPSTWPAPLNPKPQAPNPKPT